MVKIDDLPCPSALTSDVVAKKTEEFIESQKQKRVWAEKYIYKTLLEMSHEKCCYCECRLEKESNYETVDHYHHKNEYPTEVMEWNNLLPACPRCNSKKGTHNTVKLPIINPRYEEPRKHLSLYNCIFDSKTDKGELTYKVLALNDTKVLDVRTRIAQEALKSLLQLFEKANELVLSQKNASMLADLRNGFTELLREAQPDSEYSATVATSLLGHHKYYKMIGCIKKLGLWNDELDKMNEQAEEITL